MLKNIVQMKRSNVIKFCTEDSQSISCNVVQLQALIIFYENISRCYILKHTLCI